MNPNIASLFAQCVVCMVVWTLVLLAARRYFQARGVLIVQSATGLLWWLAVDLLLMTCSFFLAQSTYAMWMPSDGPLSDLSAMMRNWFAGSDLEIADIFALAVTLLVFGIAHAFVYAATLVRQSLVGPAELRPQRSLLVSYAAGAVLLGAVLFYMLRNWEAPVIAVRIAQMVGSDRFDGALDDILAIGNVWNELIAKSWLLTSVCWAWSIMIVFTAWATVKSHLAFDNALHAPDAVSAEFASGRLPSVTGEDDPIAAEPAAADRERLTARKAEIDEAVPAVVSGAETAARVASADAQALIDQNAELQEELELARRENSAHRAHWAANPTDLPNVPVPPGLQVARLGRTDGDGPPSALLANNGSERP
jgi:hypothetical protein